MSAEDFDSDIAGRLGFVKVDKFLWNGSVWQSNVCAPLLKLNQQVRKFSNVWNKSFVIILCFIKNKLNTPNLDLFDFRFSKQPHFSSTCCQRSILSSCQWPWWSDIERISWYELMFQLVWISYRPGPYSFWNVDFKCLMLNLLHSRPSHPSRTFVIHPQIVRAIVNVRQS